MLGMTICGGLGLRVNTFYDVVSLAYSLLREERDNTSNDEDDVKHLVNEGYHFLCNLRNWYFLKNEEVLKFGNTILGADAVAGDTSLTVADNSSFIVGMWVMVYSGASVFDLVKITGRGGTTGLTVSPALENDYSSGDAVYQYSHFLPWDVKSVERVYLRDDPSGNYTEGVLESLTEKDFIDEYTYINGISSQPSRWILGSMDYTRFPSSGTYTIDTSDAWSIVCNALVMDEDYGGCLLINTDRKSGARIESYNHSGKTFSLMEDIENQTTGDSIFIVRKKMVIKVFPVPSVDMKLRCSYFRVAPSLARDFDYFLLPDQFSHLPAYYACARCLARDDDTMAEAQEKIGVFNDGIYAMKKTLRYKVDKRPRLKPERYFLC